MVAFPVTPKVVVQDTAMALNLLKFLARHPFGSQWQVTERQKVSKPLGFRPHWEGRYLPRIDQLYPRFGW